MKSTLEIVQVLKLAITGALSEFCSFARFQPSKSAKMHKDQSLEPLNVLKWHIFETLEWVILISRKI